MAALVRLDLRSVVDRVAVVCGRQPQVAAAYLFGSALGACRPDSDIDVAIVPCALGTGGGSRGGRSDLRADLRLESGLETELGDVGGHRFDVTLLDAGRPLFAFPVLRDGLRAYVGDAEAHTDFIEAVARGYAENAPRHFRAVREVLAGRASGGR